jgi:alpha-beta hydrolase superfamily lysophospholipase
LGDAQRDRYVEESGTSKNAGVRENNMSATVSLQAQEAVQTPFTTFDGHTLAVYDWSLPHGVAPRAVVVIVHGLGEHAWRYDRLATEMTEAGFAVRAFDQRGHGESAGKRGCLPTQDALVKDLGEFLDDTRATVCARFNSPLVLLGHSMGGLVCALWAARQQALTPFHIVPVDALLLSSPALDAGLNVWQRTLLATLPSWLPDVTVSNGLDPALLSHDQDVVDAYLADPLVHDRISPLLGRFIADGGPEVMLHAPQWRVPTLLLYAGRDGMVNPQGSRRFAQRTPIGVVQAQCLEDFFHEIFNEVHRAEAVDALLNWLDGRF